MGVDWKQIALNMAGGAAAQYGADEFGHKLPEGWGQVARDFAAPLGGAATQVLFGDDSGWESVAKGALAGYGGGKLKRSMSPGWALPGYDIEPDGERKQLRHTPDQGESSGISSLLYSGSGEKQAIDPMKIGLGAGLLSYLGRDDPEELAQAGEEIKNMKTSGEVNRLDKIIDDIQATPNLSQQQKDVLIREARKDQGFPIDPRSSTGAPIRMLGLSGHPNFRYPSASQDSIINAASRAAAGAASRAVTGAKDGGYINGYASGGMRRDDSRDVAKALMMMGEEPTPENIMYYQAKRDSRPSASGGLASLISSDAPGYANGGIPTRALAPRRDAPLANITPEMLAEYYNMQMLQEQASRRNRGYTYGGMAEQDFTRGGYADGPGGPRTDSIPARLSDGEFVMTADAVRGAGGPRAMYGLMNDFQARA
jgi:hypothetical protein